MRKTKKTNRTIITATFLFLAGVVAGFMLFDRPEAATAGWWNDSWLYRKAIVINADYVAGSTPHEDFPVMVNFTDSDVGTHAQEDGDDILFVDTAGQKLAHEIVRYASSTGALWAYVRVPSLDYQNDTTLYLYYGNASAGDQSNAEGVWNDNFKGVWHLDEEPSNGQTVFDSTSNDCDGNWTDADSDSDTSYSAKVGIGIDFDDSNNGDYIPIGSPSALNLSGEMSFCAWIEFDDLTTDTAAFGSSDSSVTAGQYVLGVANPDNEIVIGWSGQAYTDQSSASLTTGSWYHICMTRSGTSGNWTSVIYVNGQADETVNSIATNPGNQENFSIGRTGDLAGYWFRDKLDEVVVLDTPLSAAWIETMYNNQNSTSTFFSIQSQETGPGPVGYWSFDEGYGTTANDNSGQGNIGTLNNGVRWVDESQCVSGKCLYFDGSDDYVDIVDSSIVSGQLSNLGNNNEFTLKAWIKTATSSNDAEEYWRTEKTIIELRQETASPNVSFSFGIEDKHIALGRSNTGIAEVEQGTKIINDGRWHMVAAVVNNDEVDFYVDGNLNTQRTYTLATGDVSVKRIVANMQIGVASTNGGWKEEEFFYGYIDEVKIYPYARSADEIKADYNAGLSGMQSNSGVAASFGGSSDKWMSDGLVGYWKFDESATTSGAVDSSGNGNDGTYEGNASTTVGKFGNGSIFDGSGDSIDVGSDDILDDINELTVSFWAYADSWGENSQGYLVSKGDGVSAGHGWSVQYISTNSRLIFWHVFTGDNLIVYVDDVNLGEWAHWTISWNGSGDASMVNIYKNGVEQDHISEQDGIGTRISDTGVNLLIGNYNSAARSWDGQIDEVRIYNRALSPDEVQKLYEWAPGPVAWWKFDEKSGTTTYDSAASTTMSGGNDGILGGNGIGTDVPAWTRGKYGSALQFDGDLDYIAVEKNEGLNFTDNDFTFSSWFYLEETPTAEWMYLYSSGRGDAGTDKWWMVFVDLDGELAAGFDDGSTNYFSTGAAIDLKTWYHVEAVFKQQDSIDIYLNGVYSHSRDLSAAGLGIENSDEDRIGRRTNDTSSWNGLLDDVKIYNYARTQKQILADMAGQGSDSSQGIRSLNQPVLRLSFDEGRGATAYDSSIHGNDGTLYPGTGGTNTASSAMWSLDGYSGGAMEFDGVDDYVDFEADIQNYPFTLSAWIKPSAFGSQRGVVDLADSSSSNMNFYIGVTTDEKTRLFARNTALYNIYGPTNINDDKWHLLTGVFRSATDRELFLDGRSEGTDNSSVPFFTPNRSSVGRAGDLTPGNYFDGLIDEVQIWNYALSDSEVKTVYNQGQAAVMGSVGHSTSNATSSNAQSLEYCIPGDTSPCGAPVLELTMDEKTGTTTYDTSGNGNDGVFVNTASSPAWARGKTGSGLRFDGGSDYVFINDDSSLDGMTDLSIEAWVKMDAYPSSEAAIVGKWGGSVTYDVYLLTIYNSSGYLNAAWHQSGNDTWNTTGYDNLTTTEAVPLGQWAHVAMVKEGTDMRLYINADESTSVTVADAAFDDTTVDMGIGSQISGSGVPSRYFPGLIDGVKIYDYARTPAQIAWDYNRGGPIAHWSFDECEGSVIHDMSGSNHGTLNLGTTGTTATGTCAESGTSFWYGGANGKVNSAGDFDYTDDVVDITGSGASGHLLDFTEGPFAMSAWVKHNGNPGTIVAKRDGSVAQYQMYIDDSYGSMRLIFRGGVEVGYSDTPLSSGTWYHVMAVVDSSENATLYVNGEDAGWNDGSGSLPYTFNHQDTTVSLGARWDTYPATAFEFDGLIDEVKIWNYALTSEQVKTEYNNGAVSFGN